jgi:hypothetical protein
MMLDFSFVRWVVPKIFGGYPSIDSVVFFKPKGFLIWMRRPIPGVRPC